MTIKNNRVKLLHNFLEKLVIKKVVNNVRSKNEMKTQKNQVFNKLGGVILLLSLVSFMSLTSCADQFGDNQTDNSAVQIKEKLNDVAQSLAADRTWLDAKTLEALKNGPVKVSQTMAKNTGSGFFENEEVAIELYSNSMVDAFSKSLGSAPYYVGLDPDVFHFPENIDEEASGLPVLDIPAFYFNGESVEETTVQLDPDNATNSVIFFVTTLPTQPGSMAKTTVTPGTYYCFRQITLKHRQDESNEEFELYFSSGPDPLINYINGTTTHIFNGWTWNDAAGNSRTYPDVNVKATYSTLDNQEIALVRVDNMQAGSSVRMVAIEADWATGDYYMGHYNRDQQAGSISNYLTDYYDMADNTRKLQENTAYYVDYRHILNDDRYTLGGVKSINSDNLDTRTSGGTQWMQTVNAFGGPLVHMDWVMAQKTY